MPVDIREDVFTQTARHYLSALTGYCPPSNCFIMSGVISEGWMTINAVYHLLSASLRRRFLGFFFSWSCSCVREKYLIGGGVIRWIHFMVFTLSRTSCKSCRTLLPQRCLYRGELFNWTESAWERAHNVLKQFVRTCHDAAHSKHVQIQTVKTWSLTGQRHYQS